MAAGRFLLARAAPALIRGAGSLFTKKLTIGSAIAMSAAPTALSFLDNKTGNAISEALIKSPVGQGLEKLLSMNEWSQDQKASVVSNLVIDQLEARGSVSSNDADYERTKKIADAFGHIAIGDQIGAATIATNLGINTSDLVASYNEAKDQNPNASMADIGVLSFNNLRNKIRQQELDASTQNLQQTQQIEQKQRTVAPSPSGSAGISALSGKQLSSAFDTAADNAGFMGMVLKGVSLLAGIFGESVQAGFQKWALSNMETTARHATLETASKAGNTFSKFGDAFGIGGKPNLTYTNDLEMG